MKRIDHSFTRSGDNLELMEDMLTDGSFVYDVRIRDSDDVKIEIPAYDKKDAERIFRLFVEALKA